MNQIELYHNLLTIEEKEYIHSLIEDRTKWEYKTTFDQVNEDGKKWAWYDSLKLDYDKLKTYHNFICEDGKYEIGETALNVITIDRQNNSSIHYDNADLSFSTYFDSDFDGGNFIFFDENEEKHIITPKPNLTLKINKGVVHGVEKITRGIRFSLYSFLFLKRKRNKSLL